MAKVAILVPHLDAQEQMLRLSKQYSHIDPICVAYVRTDEIEAKALELEGQGCELIIARGVQASIVGHTVKVPLVEIRVTAQELGAVILDLKRELAVEHPRLALIGFANMMCDTTQFNDLFSVDLQTYLVDGSEELTLAVQQAFRQGCLAVIGGSIVCQYAGNLGMPFRFIPFGVESMTNALGIASRIAYALDLENHNSAEMDAMLNHTFSGIMSVDREGIIRRVNRAGYDMLRQPPDQLLGKPVRQVLPNLSGELLEDTLRRGREAYAIFLDIAQQAAVVNIAPIQVGDTIDGAVLTFQEGGRIIEMDSELRRELYQRGYVAPCTFDKLVANSREMSETVALAKRIAKYTAPLLITGESGTGKDLIAQCVHNESIFHNNAFVSLDCSAWLPETLDNMLFGNYTTKKDTPACLCELAQNGTLYLSHIERLPLETQYKLLSLICGKFLHNGSHRPVGASVRVIAASSVNLRACVERGELRGDLYYALSVLSLELLPLRGRSADILGWVDLYLGKWMKTHQRYVRLTQGARQLMEKYSWPGNLHEVNNVCERIVLLAEKRSVDEVFVRRQLEQVSPIQLPGTEKIVLYKDKRAVEIAELLRKYGGNRGKVAQALGVSKTTLWRYIKKYGIGSDYTY